MGDDEHRPKRSRFDQTEPEPRRRSRFDRRSRSPSSRKPDSVRARSPLGHESRSPDADASKSTPTDPAAAAGMIHYFVYVPWNLLPLATELTDRW